MLKQRFRPNIYSDLPLVAMLAQQPNKTHYVSACMSGSLLFSRFIRGFPANVSEACVVLDTSPIHLFADDSTSSPSAEESVIYCGL